MGFFDLETGSVISRRSSHSKHHKSRKGSRSRSRSRRDKGNGLSDFFGFTTPNEKHKSSHRKSTGSLFGGDSSHYRKHNSSSASFFGLGDDSNYKKHNSSSASFFNLPNVSTRSFFGFSTSCSGVAVRATVS